MDKETERDYQPTTRNRGRPRSRTILLVLLLSLFSLVFVAGELLSGYILAYSLWTKSDTARVRGEGGTGGLPGRDFGFPGLALGMPADRGPRSRVNILLLGIDQRVYEAGQPSRTDTMMILTIDPVSKTAGMLSIPRDLYVPIPLDGASPVEDRINTAHYWGELNGYPGGGVALARKTVESNLGVRIDYYAKIDFGGFQRLIDAMGGIDVDVPVAIHDEEAPADDDRAMIVLDIPAGRHHMDGEKALQYVRTRRQDSDFGRMQRQRQVLLALRDKALQMNVLPRLPLLAIQYRDVVETDMPVQEAIALANLARKIDSGKVVSRAIDGKAVQPARTPEGAEVLRPVWAEIGRIVAEVIPGSALSSP